MFAIYAKPTTNNSIIIITIHAVLCAEACCPLLAVCWSAHPLISPRTVDTKDQRLYKRAKESSRA